MKKQKIIIYIGTAVLGIVLTLAVIDMISGDNENKSLYISGLFSVITLILTACLIYNAVKQNEISRRNIKLQLFDKRYEVFKTITTCLRVVTRQDYSKHVIAIGGEDPNFINKTILESQEKLYEVALLSQTLFDKELTEKIFRASSKYDDLCNLHFRLIKQHLASMNNPEFKDAFSKQLISTTDEEFRVTNEVIARVAPALVASIELFNSEARHFSEWLKDSGIFKDIDKYIMISELDVI